MKSMKIIIVAVVAIVAAAILYNLPSNQEDSPKSTTASQSQPVTEHQSVTQTKSATDEKPVTEEKTTTDEKVIAEVDGSKITESDLATFIKNNISDKRAKPDDAQLLDEIISQKLVVNDAIANNFENDPTFIAKMEELKVKLLINMVVSDYLEKNPVPDAMLKSTYEQQKSMLQTTEFKARHILVETEDKAKDLIKQLDNGADFATLAKKHSTGPTGKNGGDLGWFDPQQMVPEFSEALSTMEKGSHSSTPVKTQFGWHVILKEDVRTSEPPSFEELKPQIIKALRGKQIQDYLDGLRNKAKIVKY